jgi:molybdate-binding protein/DNA-binding XRE family transcriptional regulator
MNTGRYASIATLENFVGARRKMHGLTQLALAERTGITRQSIVNIENGRFVPSTNVALKLARLFDCRVEDLFVLEEAKEAITAHLAPAFTDSRDTTSSRGCDELGRHHPIECRRVVMGFVAGRWVAHRLYGEDAVKMVADGVIRSAPTRGTKAKSVQIEPLRPETAVRENLIVAGCDPALPILATWLRESPRSIRLNCIHAPSRQALEALAHDLTHLAGTHLLDAASGEYNVPFVRRLFPKGGAIVVNLGRWEEGFVVVRGNPLGIRSVGDLASRRVRVVQREQGAGARTLLDRLLRHARIPPRAISSIPRAATGHLAVARAISQGTADVGVATRSAASAFGLGFLPLAEERSDLVFSEELRDDVRVERIVDTLRSSAFRRELDTLDGYGTEQSGDIVAEVTSA